MAKARRDARRRRAHALFRRGADVLPRGLARPGLPDHGEFLRREELQHLRFLCVGRGRACRPHRRLGGDPCRLAVTIDGLDHAKRLEAQRLLRKLGLYSDKLDGYLGPSLREAVRRFQAQNGMIADGFPTPELLAKLRAAK